jgi:hypothetical protein
MPAPYMPWALVTESNAGKFRWQVAANANGIFSEAGRLIFGTKLIGFFMTVFWAMTFA